MQALRQHKVLALIPLLLAVVLVVSVVVYIQSAPQTTPSARPTPPPTASPSPSPTPQSSTTPPTSTSHPTTYSTNPPAGTPQPALPSTLLPGEATNYSGTKLTPISTYIYYLDTHPDVAIKGVQYLDPATYRLKITGLVNTPKNYAYAEVVEGFNSTLQVATLPCVEGWSVTMLWQGVKISDILQDTGVASGANTVIFFAADGYSSSLPLQYVQDNDIMIAYKMNDLTLTPQLGYPFFLVAKNQYGYKWVEWITEINVSDNPNYLGYWESRGYPNDATVQSVVGSAQTFNNLPVAALFVFTISIIAGVVAVDVLRSRRRKLDLGAT